ncbi:biotin/lipoyl-containing protein [Salinactinospora qingdaonensis]|uniref:Lipoyl-binding domain-containing protein n=1 Tax=Salinactinospora qingdaonensis TaxID=702744 RepID=A0ABP7F5V7_9ACTN
MDNEVRLPQYGMGMSEAEILEWYVEEGDTVVEGADLLEIEAEKAREVLPAPATGTLKQIVAHPGEVVEVRALLGVIVSEDE